MKILFDFQYSLKRSFAGKPDASRIGLRTADIYFKIAGLYNALPVVIYNGKLFGKYFKGYFTGFPAFKFYPLYP